MASSLSSGARINNADGKIIIGTSVDTGGINTGLKKISNSFQKLKYLTGGALGIVGFVRFGKAALDAASDLQEVQNIVDVAFGDMSYKVEAFASTCIDKFGISELAAKQTAGSFMAMGKSMGLTMEEASNMAISLAGLTGDFASFYNISQDYARVALSAVYTGETETLKRYGIILTEANLQQFALSQGIQTSVKAMDAHSKAMLRYQYILSATKDMQGDFARTSNSWANQVRLLQQQWTVFLQTIGKGLITVLAPLLKMLNMIIAAMTRMAKVIGATLSRIFGIKWQNFTSGASSGAAATEDLSDNLEDVASNTKTANEEAEKMLGTYDELSVIKIDTPDTSGSGGSGAAGPDWTIPEADTSALDKLADKIKSFDSLFDLGRWISKKLEKTLRDIDWGSIYKGARTFGTGLADFLNGLITPGLFGSVGKTIASALNTAIYTALSFGKTLDWENLGVSIAEGINEFFRTFDFTALANTIDAWVQGLWTLLWTTIHNIDWSEVFKGAFDFFSALDGKTIDILGMVVAFKLLSKVIKGINFWKLLAPLFNIKNATTGVEFVIGLFKNLGEVIALTAGGAGTLAESFAAVFGTIGTAIAGVGSIITGAVLAVKNFFDMWKKGFDWLNEIFMVIGIALAALGAIILGVAAAPALIVAGIVAAVATLTIVIKDHWKEIKAFFEKIGKWIKDKVGKLVDGIKDKFGEIKEGIKEKFEAIKEVFNGLKDKLIGPFKNALEWIKNNWKNILLFIVNPFAGIFKALYDNVEGFRNFIDGIVTAIKSMFSGIAQTIKDVFYTIWIIIKAIWILASTWFKVTVIDPIVSFFTNMWTVVTGLFTSLWNGIVTIWTNVANWFNSNVIQPLITFFKNVWTNVSMFFTNLWNGIKSVWSTVSTWFSTQVIQPVKIMFQILVSTVKGFFSGLWEGIKSIWTSASNWFITYVTTPIANAFNAMWGTIKGVINFMLAGVEGLINHIIDGINFFLGGLETVGKAAAAVTGDNYSGITKIAHTSLPRLASGAVIPPNKEFMAILGDQKHGTNIETPLDTMIQAFKTAIGEMGGAGNNQNVVLQLNGKQIAQAVWDENEKRYKQTNKSYAY